MTKFKRTFVATTACAIVAATMPARTHALKAGAFESTQPDNSPVHALFNLHHPETGPFPSDIFTVADRTHNTGRRVNLA